jgi:hypothetical protein
VTMEVEVAEQAAPILTLGKVDNQGAPIRPEHAPDLLRAALPQWWRQVMKHECAQDDVELRVGKEGALRPQRGETSRPPVHALLSSALLQSSRVTRRCQRPCLWDRPAASLQWQGFPFYNRYRAPIRLERDARGLPGFF